MGGVTGSWEAGSSLCCVPVAPRFPHPSISSHKSGLCQGPPLCRGVPTVPCRVLGALGPSWAPGNHLVPRPSPGSPGEALLSTIQRAAEAVAHAVLPSPGGHRPRHGDLHEDTYEPVRAPSPPRSPATAGKPPAATTAHGTRGRSPHAGLGQLLGGLVGVPVRGCLGSARPRCVPAVRHQPGLAGGGWEEADSGHSSQDSSQGIGDLSRTSDSCSKSGSDSHCGASRELSHAAER